MDLLDLSPADQLVVAQPAPIARLPDERLVLDAARIKADHPMADADADAFAAALTVTQAATLWTGDPELLVDNVAWRWRDLRS